MDSLKKSKVTDINKYANIKALNESFFVKYDKKYGGGYVYVCKKCGAIANCKEFFCKAADHFIPEWVICSSFPQCSGYWRMRVWQQQ